MSRELKGMPYVTVEQVLRFRTAALNEVERLQQRVQELEKAAREVITTKPNYQPKGEDMFVSRTAMLNLWALVGIEPPQEVADNE